MNWYFYWFYTIYNIYNRLSWDKHFDIFASGMFSIIISFWVIGILNVVFILLKLTDILLISKYTFPSIFVFIILLNGIYFLNKSRQIRQYNNYKEQQSTTRNLIAIIFSVLSVVIFLFTILHIRELYVG